MKPESSLPRRMPKERRRIKRSLSYVKRWPSFRGSWPSPVRSVANVSSKPNSLDSLSKSLDLWVAELEEIQDSCRRPEAEKDKLSR